MDPVRRDLAHGADARLLDLLDGPQRELQARIDGARILAKTQHNAALIRLHLVDGIVEHEGAEERDGQQP